MITMDKNRAKIVVFSNQKGGVGKTAMAYEFASGLKRKGLKVLAVDVDPQGNLSEGARAAIGRDIPAERPTMYELIKGACTVKDAIFSAPNFDIIPTNIMLSSAEQEISSQVGREYILKESLEPVISEYDYVVIDTPPALGTLTVNAFVAADEIIIPILPDAYAVGGVKKLYDAVNLVKKRCNPSLTIRGIVFTQFDFNTNNSQTIQAVMDSVMTILKIPAFRTQIRKSVAVPSSRTARMTVTEYCATQKRQYPVKGDIDAFVEEYLKGENQ